MFVMNGIVYASEISGNVQIVDAKPLEDMMMILTFSTGAVSYTHLRAHET